MRLRAYRGEWLVLLLAAGCALVLVNPLNTQDVSRLALTTQLLDHGSLRIDRYAHDTRDRARFDGHTYSDKAPGVAFAAVVPAAVLKGVDAVRGTSHPPPLWQRVTHLWLIRLAIGGTAFLTLVLLVGRAAEGLAAGTGAAAALTFGLGTMAGPLSIALFEHLPGAALAFGGFLLATRRRFAAAGLLAGAAVLFEYQDALLALVVLLYALAAAGPRPALRLLAGALPAAVLLGAYDELAWKSPWRLSYRYVQNDFTRRQHQGFFGISAPDAHGAWTFLADGHGLLVVSPVVLAAAAGLAALRRTHRLEANACLAATVVFAVLTCGYFDPDGGTSPGPRFFAPALPFLALGLAAAYRRAPRATAALAVASIAMTTFDSLTWAIENALRLDQLPETVWSRLGAPRSAGVALVSAAAAGAALLVVRAAARLDTAGAQRPRRRRSRATYST